MHKEMSISQRQLLVNKIILGETHFQISGKEYIHKPASRATLYKAELVYQDTIEENKYLGLLSNNEVKPTLIGLGLWSADSDKVLEGCEKAIKDSCVELYRAAFDFKRQKDIRRRLESLRHRQSDMITRLRYFDSATIEALATLQKTQYIIVNSVYDENGKLIDADDVPLLTRIINEINKYNISIDDFKQLAKTDPWRSIWSVDNINIFGKPSCDLTDEQRTLVSLSKFYDSIYEHPECPSDNVLNDNDMLEGWLILQQREREASKKQKSADNILGLTDKMKNAVGNDVMIVANSPEEAFEINSQNDMSSQIIKRERMAVIKQKGTAEDMDFRDIKLEALKQANGR